MKKLLATLFIIGAWAGLARAEGEWMEFFKNTVGETEITITKSGGAAGFSDFSSGNDYTLKEGLLSNVLTNRFVAASMGWYTSPTKEGVLVGGPSILIDQIFKTLAPGAAEIFSPLVPGIVKPLQFGFFYGWGTDSGTQHYGFSLMYNFGGTDK